MLAKSGFRYPKPPDDGPDPDQVTNDRDRESPEIPAKSGLGPKKSEYFPDSESRTRPNRDHWQENPEYFPGQIGAGKGEIRGFRPGLAPATEPTR
jgi:hypothetical protein